MRKKVFGMSVFVLLALCVVVSAVQAAKKPNILVLWGDRKSVV